MNAIGINGDGTTVIAYRGGYIELYDSKSLELINSFPSTPNIQQPEVAYVDPHSAYLLVRQSHLYGLTTWGCFKFATGQLLWTKCSIFTLNIPGWYSENMHSNVSSICLQNHDFYGIDLSRGIDLETGSIIPLQSYKNCPCAQYSSNSNLSGGSYDGTLYLCGTTIYDGDNIRHIQSVYDPNTNIIECKIADKIARVQVNETEQLENGFAPIHLVAQIKSTNDIIVIMNCGDVYQATLTE